MFDFLCINSLEYGVCMVMGSQHIKTCSIFDAKDDKKPIY